MWLLIAGCLTIWFVAAGCFGVTFGRVVQQRDRQEGRTDSARDLRGSQALSSWVTR
jgi:hypothetical protein